MYMVYSKTDQTYRFVRKGTGAEKVLNNCNLCYGLDLISACIIHDLHGEDYCERAERGRVEEQEQTLKLPDWESEGGK